MPSRRSTWHASRPPSAKPAAKAKAQARPAWAELTAEQQKILAPLKADWESLDPERRRKWIGIAKRYPTMKAEEQERVSGACSAGPRSRPSSAAQARESYKQIVKAPPEKRAKLRQQWAEYQSLPQREREAVTPEPPQKIDDPLSTPGLPRRLASMAYEAVLLFAVAFFAAWLFFFASGARDATSGSLRHALQLFIGVVFASLLPVVLAARRPDPCDEGLGIRLVESPVRALLRCPRGRARADGSVDRVRCLIAKQFLHDRLAGTRLVSA